MATVYGATETVVTNLEPGLRYNVKVMATDGDGNTSLETKPLSIKMPYQSFVARDDVNIYLAEDFLANPVFDDDNTAGVCKGCFGLNSLICLISNVSNQHCSLTLGAIIKRASDELALLLLRL